LRQVGGLLGVLFTIPLRRALIVTARLRFPEGVATAEVLKVAAPAEGEVVDRSYAAGDFRTLLSAALLGGAVKFGESGLRLWAESLEGAANIGRTVLYAGLNLSPALLAVGFIIGLNTAVVVFLGGVIGWLLLMPVYGILDGLPPGKTGLVAAMTIWSGQIRYVGIGAMLTGGPLDVDRSSANRCGKVLRRCVIAIAQLDRPTRPPSRGRSRMRRFPGSSFHLSWRCFRWPGSTRRS
jgi:putative OPT family oligopeptide transporter